MTGPQKQFREVLQAPVTDKTYKVIKRLADCERCTVAQMVHTLVDEALRMRGKHHAN